MPIVARFLDLYRCPAHVGGAVITGDPTVLICFRPAARKGDKAMCLGGVDTIVEGDPSVLIGGIPAALKGHKTEHGGILLTGCPRVRIGRRIKASCKLRAAKKRSAFIRYGAKASKPFIAEM